MQTQLESQLVSRPVSLLAGDSVSEAASQSTDYQSAIQSVSQ